MTERLPTVTPARQTQLLDEAIMRATMRGGRLVTRAGSQAIMDFGERPNHVLHAILSIFTFGAWLFVWALLSATNKVTRKTLMVDEYGRAWIQAGRSWEPF